MYNNKMCNAVKTSALVAKKMEGFRNLKAG